MNLLESPEIRLRALEPEDIELLYRWENDTSVWGVSQTTRPFSRYLLRRFIEEQVREIHQTGQTRFVVEIACEHRPAGLIDLFDYDPVNLRAGVGILIHEPADRGKGYAAEALRLLVRYAFEALGLRQLYADIPASNAASRRLFEACGFVACGCKKQWRKTAAGWEDEYLFQLLRDRPRE